MALTEEQQRRLEIEVVLRDSFSSMLRQVSKDMDAFIKKVLDGGDLGSATWEKFRKSMSRAEEDAKHSTGSLLGFSDVLKSIPKQVWGPLGVAAAFYEIGKAFTGFIGQQTAIRTMAADAGFATEELKKLLNTLELVGYSVKERQEIATGIGGRFQEARLHPLTSQYTQAMRRIVSPDPKMAGINVARKTIAEAAAGVPYLQLFKENVEYYQELGRMMEAEKDPRIKANLRRSQLVVANEAFGVPESVFKGYIEASRRAVAPPKLTEEEEARQQRIDEGIKVTTQTFWDQLERIGGKVGANLWEPSKDPRNSRTIGLPMERLLMRPFVAEKEVNLLGQIRDILQRWTMPGSGASASPAPADAPPSPPSEPPPSSTAPPPATAPFPAPAPTASPSLGSRIMGVAKGLVGRASGGPVTEGQPYLVGEAGPEWFTPDRMGRVDPVISDRQLLASIGMASGIQGIMSLGGLGSALEAAVATRGTAATLQAAIALGRTAYSGGVSALGFAGGFYHGGLEEAGMANVPMSGSARFLASQQQRLRSFVQSFHPVTSLDEVRSRLDRSFRGKKKVSTVSAEVDFSDMPTGQASDVFMPVSIMTAPMAMKAGISYDHGVYQ